MDSKFFYECIHCGKQIPGDTIIYLCPECSKKQSPGAPPLGVLKVNFDFEQLKKLPLHELQNQHFFELMPLQNQESLTYLKVGQTPLYRLAALNHQETSFQLFLKDDSQNPTFSFKDRASAVVSAYAKEKKLDTLVAASTGNAGSSLAGICASQGQKAVIFVPATAPKAKLTQIMMYGARLVPIEGNYDAAFDLSIQATEYFGWYNRNTAFNPLTIEGKKTVSFEIFQQLGNSIPDRIFVPVGDGVIISGVYKGFEDLLKLGHIQKMPLIVAVQSTGSCNVVRNLNSDHFNIIPSSTIADSISVDIPRNFYMTRQFMSQYHGEGCEVSDEEIIAASLELSRNTGIFAEPAAATAFAGMKQYSQNHLLKKEEKVVVLLTGSGLKDLQSVQTSIAIPPAVSPEFDTVIQHLKK